MKWLLCCKDTRRATLQEAMEQRPPSSGFSYSCDFSTFSTLWCLFLLRHICRLLWWGAWKRSKWGTKPWGPDSTPGALCKVRPLYKQVNRSVFVLLKQTQRWVREEVTGYLNLFLRLFKNEYLKQQEKRCQAATLDQLIYKMKKCRFVRNRKRKYSRSVCWNQKFDVYYNILRLIW